MALSPQEERIFFVTSVTIGRKLLFRSRLFCELLLDVFGENRCEKRLLLHEFVIMPNHFHAILTPAHDVSLEKVMQCIKGGFSYRAKNELRFGFEIWQPGFTQHRIKDTDDYDAHVDYIWNNPVRARLVLRPQQYPYSSARRKDLVDPAPAWAQKRFVAGVG
jgi:REP-associated tyrosine transposase